MTHRVLPREEIAETRRKGTDQPSAMAAAIHPIIDCPGGITDTEVWKKLNDIFSACKAFGK